MLTAEQRYAETCYTVQNRAMEVLAELLEQATDPLERRRIATVIMRAKRPAPPAAKTKAPAEPPAPRNAPPPAPEPKPLPPLPDFTGDLHPYAPGDKLIQAHAELMRTVEEAQQRQSSP